MVTEEALCGPGVCDMGAVDTMGQETPSTLSEVRGPQPTFKPVECHSCSVAWRSWVCVGGGLWLLPRGPGCAVSWAPACRHEDARRPRGSTDGHPSLTLRPWALGGSPVLPGQSHRDPQPRPSVLPPNSDRLLKPESVPSTVATL